jgi:hypothetical protein
MMGEKDLWAIKTDHKDRIRSFGFMFEKSGVYIMTEVEEV